MEVVFFFVGIRNIELDFNIIDFPLLLFAAFDFKNLINGGGNFSILPGLEMGFVVDSFMMMMIP